MWVAQLWVVNVGINSTFKDVGVRCRFGQLSPSCLADLDVWYLLGLCHGHNLQGDVPQKPGTWPR
jgi:hypothetical protein